MYLVQKKTAQYQILKALKNLRILGLMIISGLLQSVQALEVKSCAGGGGIYIHHGFYHLYKYINQISINGSFYHL